MGIDRSFSFDVRTHNQKRFDLKLQRSFKSFSKILCFAFLLKTFLFIN